MEDWKLKIEGWQARLTQWQQRFDAEYARLARERKGWFRKLSQGELDECAAQARKLAGEDLAVELFGFLAGLCDAYRAEPLPQPRAKVRAWVGAQPETLNAAWNFSQQALELARGSDAQRALERGLAALSIVDVRVDFNAVHVLLGQYWLAARRAAVDPKALFASTAALSNRGMGGGGAHFSQMLAEFEGSAYFRDHVRPQLSRASA
jgi:hypothetical protein